MSYLCFFLYIVFVIMVPFYCMFDSIVYFSARSKKVIVLDEGTSNPWNHLLENPKEWLDCRGSKASGLVNIF